MTVDRRRVLEEGKRWMNRGKFARAVELYASLALAHPTDAELFERLGAAQRRLGLHADAAASFERAAIAFEAQRAPAAALNAFRTMRAIVNESVLGLRPRFAHAWSRLAEGLQQEDAAPPNEVRSVAFELSDIYEQNGWIDRAIAACRDLEDRLPADPLPKARLADVLLRHGHIDEGAKALTRAAWAHAQVGAFDAAFQSMERAVALRRDIASSRSAAELYLACGPSNAALLALEHLQPCYRAAPLDLGVLALMARAFLAVGESARCAEVWGEMRRIGQHAARAAHRSSFGAYERAQSFARPDPRDSRPSQPNEQTDVTMVMVRRELVRERSARS